MRLKTQTASRLHRGHNSGGFCTRVAVLTLLVALAGFSTFAKLSQYFPKPNPAQYVSISSKMKVAQSTVIVDRHMLYPVARVVPPHPVRTIRLEPLSLVSIRRIGLTVCIRHRSPPYLSA